MNKVFGADSKCHSQLSKELDSLKKEITSVEDDCFSVWYTYAPSAEV